MSMAKFRGSLFGKTLLLFLAVIYISCQNSLCPAAFTADRFNFKVERTHLQKGRILGKVSFSDCRGPQRALFFFFLQRTLALKWIQMGQLA
ncbi:hypothetical protein AGOR_G00167740 [Albula goreensis]|uniref:Cadherin prodomain domain-containing protein n=1 Tax=Albula goreensis TaxID=1534307 RepID=A0A8T3D0H9_9TELE|nr:hypothetical protein AGOR_G00167740 [Albula goreensis]